MSRTIPLSRGYATTVDDEDYEWLNQWTWYAASCSSALYAATNLPRGSEARHLYMHRLLLNALPGKQVDHKNHDTLDNRRENLRLCSRAENQRNRLKAQGTSQYKGVSLYVNGKWRAKIKKDGRQRSLGHFVNEEDAARAYDRAAVELFGEYAALNFPRQLERPARPRVRRG